MRTRTPIVAGQFYPAGQEKCLEEIRRCLAARPLPEALPPALVAGIVPHAGWTFSGELAALVFAAVKKRHQTVATFVIYGTAHSYFHALPAVDDCDAWQTPLGAVQIDKDLCTALLDRGVVLANSGAHRQEHSIEVQLPFIQHLFPNARIVPILVPPVESSIPLGEAAGALTAETDRRIVHIGSTDLTHYGPRYNFTPMGRGPEAYQWASDVNDRQFVDLGVAMDAERLLAGAIEKGNACGPGAAAAVVAAARKLGVTRGQLLAYTTSNDVMQAKMGSTARDSVGYAAIVF